MDNLTNVIISDKSKQYPEPHEISAALILSEHFNCQITFIKPRDCYKLKTPDFVMHALDWELKSPIGNSKTTISNNIINAKSQSSNIIIDTRRTKLEDEMIRIELVKQARKRKSILRLIMITKDEKVLVIK